MLLPGFGSFLLIKRYLFDIISLSQSEIVLNQIPM